MKLIGIFGGTFDPIHNGHVRPVREVMQALGFAQVRFIPAAQPPHRPPPCVAAWQRLAMVQLAINNEPGFLVDTREIERPGASFTIDTLESLQRELDPKKVRLCLILGLDAFLGLESWCRWQDIVRLAHLIVMQRPGTQPAPLPALLRPVDNAAALYEQQGGLVIMQSVTPQPISASAIRAAIANGEEVMKLPLAPAVAAYIRDHKLYFGNKETDASKKNAATYF